MKIRYTAHGKTLEVEATPHNMEEHEEPDEVLWVERGEDYYALMSPQLKHKKVAIVTRENWLRAANQL